MKYLYTFLGLFAVASGGYYVAADNTIPWQVESPATILDGTFELGDVIVSSATGSRYRVGQDSLRGYPIDSIAVIPVNVGYAILEPDNGTITPTMFDLPEWGESTTAAEQRTMDFAGANRFVGEVRYAAGYFYKRDSGEVVVVSHRIADHGRFTFNVSGPGATIRVGENAKGFLFKANDSPSRPGTTECKLTFENLAFEGGNRTGSMGIRTAGASRSITRNIRFNRLDTGMLATFCLNSTIEDVWVGQCKTAGLVLAADGAPGIPSLWKGASQTNSAFNVNTVRQIRIFGAAGNHVGIDVKSGSSNRLEDITIEGVQGDIGIRILEYLNPVAGGNIISNVHFEDQAPDRAVGSIGIYLGSQHGMVDPYVLTGIKKQTSSGTSDTLVYLEQKANAVFDRVAFPWYQGDHSFITVMEMEAAAKYDGYDLATEVLNANPKRLIEK